MFNLDKNPLSSTVVDTAPHISTYFGNETLIMQPLADVDWDNMEEMENMEKSYDRDTTTKIADQNIEEDIQVEPMKKQTKPTYSLHSISRSERRYPIFNFINNETNGIVIMTKVNCNKTDITLKCSDIDCDGKIKIVPISEICNEKIVYNSARIQLDLENINTYLVESYSVRSVVNDHSCKNMAEQEEHQTCLSFTKKYVLEHSNLEASVLDIYNRMLDYAILSMGSLYVINNWPNPSHVRQFIKRARQTLRTNSPEIEPNDISDNLKKHQQSQYQFSDEICFFEHQRVLHIVNQNEQLIFYHPQCLKYLSSCNNVRLQLDGTMWCITPGVYNQVLILIATTEVAAGQYLDIPVCFAFMSCRTEAAYDLLFRSINKLIKKECGKTMDSQLVVTDHEAGLMASIKKFINFDVGSRSLRLCSFHSNQIIRKLFRSKLGQELTTLGQQFNAQIYKFYIQCFKLYLLPVDVSLSLLDLMIKQAETETFDTLCGKNTQLREALLYCLVNQSKIYS